MKAYNMAFSIGSMALPSLFLALPWTTGFVLPSSSSLHRFGITSPHTGTTDPTTPSTTTLSMGIMEDFLSGTDETLRSKSNSKYLSELDKRVERINALEAEIEELDDDELMAKTDEFRKRLADGEDINGPILEEAFAVVREAAWRVLELRHYDVQLTAGLILHDGRLAEMATGEGKTLVSTLPCYLNALTGSPSFVVTVNDYLAKRDMEKMGQIHRFLGLTVGLVQGTTEAEKRSEAYGCDVVYVTNSELGFDYLRDHLALGKGQTVLPRGGEEGGEFSGFCVVDEADSVLIDEARTPLIISKQVPAVAARYEVSNTIADALRPDVHYTVDVKNKNVIMNERGYRDCENSLGIQSLFSVADEKGNQMEGGAWAPYILNAVKAKELFERDVEYSVLVDEKSGEKTGVGIIDAFTGRVLDGRRWSDGLHQSIEAREGIEVSSQSKVIAKVTYQALFRQFTRLSGMTGTALSDATELAQTYGLLVTPVPTALPIARRDYPDVSYKTRAAADKALIREIVAVGGGQPDGRPCLVGTTSVAQSESIVKVLEGEGIKAELLNASPKNAPRESEIVAQAGRAGVVTVATNMAGRGTDILLGGCPATMSRIKSRGVLVDAGVVNAEETGRLPPMPVEDYFPCAIGEDVELALKDAAASIRKELGDDLSVVQLDELLTIATDTTEAEDDPTHVVKLRDSIAAVRETYAAVLSAEKKAVKECGGLYVMGTNRHESSRIDSQLRGRAGRQGDPGSSRFFLSFEDDMYVVFGGDGLAKILETFRVSEDMPVEAPQVTEALDRVQKAVEEKYRDIREQVLQFDEVLNDQRRVVYRKREKVLEMDMEGMVTMIAEENEQTVKDIVEAQTDGESGVVDTKKVLEKIAQFFPPVAPLVQADDVEGLDREGVSTFLCVAVDEVLRAKVEELDGKAKKDGRPLNSLARSANYITLVTMDNAWSDHLQMMEDLKEAVVLRKYQNLDPVAEYKNEAFLLFEGLLDKMRFNAVFSLWQSL